jgi:4-amino-4-deoxy-L-arabinose transferase-like glycosyltransferase
MERSSTLKDVGILTLVLGVLFLAFLGHRPFSAPDEGRYVEIPREMVATGDYLTPRLNGLKYFEKPPLGYWIQAGFIQAFGMSEFAMRLPLVLLGLMGCIAVYLAGRQLFNREAGLWGATVLGTSFLYYTLTRIITLDMLVSICLTIGLLAFLCAMQHKAGRTRRWLMYLCYASCGGAFLSKGLIGIALPGCIIGLWVLLQNYWKNLLPLYLPTGLTLFLLITLPWPLMMSFKHPEFAHFYFIYEHFERFLTTAHRRSQPWWFFFPVTILGFWPWVGFMPRTITHLWTKTTHQERSKVLYLVLWIAFIFFFFSCSNSKLIPYILPIFPPMALLIGLYLSHQLKRPNRLKTDFFLYSFLGLALVAGLLYAYYAKGLDLPLSLRPYLVVTVITMGISGGFLPLLRLRFGDTGALYGLIFSHVLLLSTLNLASPIINRISVKGFAETILTKMPSQTQVMTYHAYYQDLPVYLNRTVQVVEWEGELSHGASWDPNQQIIIKEDSFKKTWTSGQPVCIITRQDFYNNILGFEVPPILVQTEDTHVLACNFNPS